MLICRLREQLSQRDRVLHQGVHGRRENKLLEPIQVGLPKLQLHREGTTEQRLPFLHHHRMCSSQLHSLCNKVKLPQNGLGSEDKEAYLNQGFIVG